MSTCLEKPRVFLAKFGQLLRQRIEFLLLGTKRKREMYNKYLRPLDMNVIINNYIMEQKLKNHNAVI